MQKLDAPPMAPDQNTLSVCVALKDVWFPPLESRGSKAIDFDGFFEGGDLTGKR
jgi:hypothetical protein